MRANATRPLKLSIELIPTPCWGRNLRSVLPDSRWTKISRDVREAAGGKCEICGGTNRIQCDEHWTYDDRRHVQGLVALRAVCQTCHNVMNLGRTSIIARQMADRYPTLMADVTAHFMKVNGVDRSFFDQHKTAAFTQWSERSAHKDWAVDYGDYAPLVAEVEAMRAQRRGKSTL
jgi:hypothetical protein